MQILLRSDEMSLMYPSSADNARFTMVRTASGLVQRVIRFLAGNYPDLPTSAVKRTRVGLVCGESVEIRKFTRVCSLFGVPCGRQFDGRITGGAPVCRHPCSAAVFIVFVRSTETRAAAAIGPETVCIVVASFMYKTKP